MAIEKQSTQINNRDLHKISSLKNNGKHEIDDVIKK